MAAEKPVKGPLWVVLAAALFFILLQVLRVLALPDTVLGVLARSTIEVAGAYGIVVLCVTRVRVLPFFAIVLPFTALGHFVWAPYMQALSKQGGDMPVILGAVLFGFATGGVIATWLGSCQ